MLFAGAAAVLAALGGASPTGLQLIDWLYVGGAGATLAMAGARSRRVGWLGSGIIALWLAPSTAGRVAAIAALALALYAVRTGRRRYLGAVIGAAVAFVLGDLGNGPFVGATTLFALLAAAPILLSGARLMPDHWRRPVGLAISTSAAAAALATGVFALSGLLAIGDVGEGVDAATIGFDLVSDGEQDAAATAFSGASSSFDDARTKVSGFWTLPARLVPLVGQHVRAVQVVAGEGVALTDTAADTARSVDPDEVRLVDGRLDLGLLDDLQPVMDRAERAIERARDRVDGARSDWLISPLERRMSELIVDLDDAYPSARTATLAVHELPAMLGADGPVRWLVALTTPAEARGLGGLLGNWVVVEASDGAVEIVQSGRNEDINTLLRSRGVELAGPAQYLDRWGSFTPEEFFQDVTLSPDLPMVAEVTADLFEKATDTPIDGVVFLDPYALAAVVQLGGSIETDDLDLDAGAVVSFLLTQQYVEYVDDEIGRVVALNDLVEGAFASFTTGSLPGPRAVVDVLGPIVDQDRLGLWWSAGGKPADLITAAGLDGAWPDAADGDLLAVVHQNAGQNKLDTYLRRQVSYDLEVVDGQAEATITVTLHNELTDLTLPAAIIASNDQDYPLGTNVARVGVHTVLGLQEATLDGEALGMTRQTAFGHEAVTAVVEIPPGATRVLELRVRGPLDIARSEYGLTLPAQPLVNVDTIEVSVTIDGLELGLPATIDLAQDRVLTADPG